MAGGGSDLDHAGRAHEKTERQIHRFNRNPVRRAQKAAARRSVNHELQKYLRSSEDVGGGAAHCGRECCRCVVAAGRFAGQSGNRHRGVIGKRAGHGASRVVGKGSRIGRKPSKRGTAKLGAWMFIALLIPLPWMQGCTAAGVAQNIVNWTPALQSAVATVDSTAALLAPADAPIFAAATIGFDVASNLLVAQARAYLANPSASTLGKLQSQIVTFQQQVNTALLQAARIVDQKSQQHALAAIQGVGTIVVAILSLVQSISSKAQLAQMAASSGVKLATIAPYLNESRAAEIVAAHYGEPIQLARAQVAQVTQAEMTAGF